MSTNARRMAPILLLLGLLLMAGCGSAGRESAGTTSSSVDPATASSVPPAPSTLPPSAKAPCTALATALTVNDLSPKNSGNWMAERQRIVTDVAGTTALLAAAAEGVPSDVARAIGTIQDYITRVGTTVSAASSYDAAKRALDALPGRADVTSATSVVDAWRRSNC